MKREKNVYSLLLNGADEKNVHTHTAKRKCGTILTIGGFT